MTNTEWATGLMGGRGWRGVCIAIATYGGLAVMTGCAALEPREAVGAEREALGCGACTNDCDCDGVLDSVDNCQTIPNPDQANRNFDAENDMQGISHPPPILGDACDPQPAPWLFATVEDITTGGGGLTGWLSATTHDLEPVIGVTANIDVVTNDDGATPSTFPTERYAETGLQMCRCDAAANNDSATRTSCKGGTPVCALRDVTHYDNPPALAATRGWHTLTLGTSVSTAWYTPSGSVPSTSDTAITGGTNVVTNNGGGRTGAEFEVGLDYFATTPTRTRTWAAWHFDGDSDAFGGGGGSTHDIHGVIAGHGRGALGGTEYVSTTIGTSWFNSPNRNLTFSYWSGENATAAFSTPGWAPPGSDTIPLGPGSLIPQGICINCANGMPAAGIEMPTCAAPCNNPGDPALRFPGGYIGIASLFGTNVAKDVELDTGHWIAAVEPASYINASSGYAYASLATDASKINLILQYASTITEAALGAQATHPSARSSFGAVLSQRLGKIFVIGGVNGGGTNQNDLWTYNIGTKAWAQTSLAGLNKVPGVVYAATYSPDHNAIILLDATSATSTTVRLLTLAIDGSSCTQLTSWSRTTETNTSFVMASAHDGYTITCSDSAGGNTLLHITNSGGWAIKDYGTQSWAIAQVTPAVNNLYTTIYAFHSHEAIPEIYYLDKLTQVGGGTAARCFF